MERQTSKYLNSLKLDDSLSQSNFRKFSVNLDDTRSNTNTLLNQSRRVVSRIEKNRIMEIKKNNQILLRKMLSIESHPFFSNKIIKKAHDNHELSSNSKKFKTNTQLINENKKMAERIKNAKSSYQVIKLKEDYKKHNKLKKIRSKYNSNVSKKFKDLSYYDKLIAKELKKQELYKKNIFFQL